MAPQNKAAATDSCGLRRCELTASHISSLSIRIRCGGCSPAGSSSPARRASVSPAADAASDRGACGGCWRGAAAAALLRGRLEPGLGSYFGSSSGLDLATGKLRLCCCILERRGWAHTRLMVGFRSRTRGRRAQKSASLLSILINGRHDAASSRYFF